MKHTFSSNSSITEGPSQGQSILLVGSGTWGGGTLTVSVRDDASGDYVALYSTTADFSKEIVLGANRLYRITLAGAAGPSLAVYILDV